MNEEIEGKVKELSKKINEGEWTEVEMDEELKGGQKKIDVAEPKGKITSADFKKLRDAKKHKEEVEEWFFYDKEEDESTPGDYEGDEEEEEEAEELSAQEPTYVGKGLADNKIKNKIRNKIFGSFNEEDGETQEGNAFSGALDKAKKNHDKSFEVDGHTYPVKEGRDKFDGKKSKVIGVYSNIKKQREMKEDDDKWIQKTHMKKGALHKKLGIPEGDKIPQSKLKSLKAELHKKSEGDKKLSVADSKLLKQVNLALTLKSVKESKNSLRLSETELIDMIESLVLEQKVKDVILNYKN